MSIGDPTHFEILSYGESRVTGTGAMPGLTIAFDLVNCGVDESYWDGRSDIPPETAASSTQETPEAGGKRRSRRGGWGLRFR